MGLYHKYRPQKFSDVAGQEHVKKTVVNSLKSGKTSHAYLFSGPRGVGKTTVARLLAKSLNCEGKKEDFEPCDACSNCKDVLADNSLDVIEIDAASNRGIDEIRDLREKIKFAPTKSKYKVYIIDEVHMLTKEAFNALLKTLEEPPKHAIFVMATTELNKVPPTILSRVQQFDFRRASVDSIFGYIKGIADKEKIKIEAPALRLVAIMGDGSYRDATSILDQVSSIGEHITVSDVRELLGLSEDKTIYDFITYLGDGNTEKSLELINKLFEDGLDLADFNKKVIETLRKMLIAKASAELITKAEITDEEKMALITLANKFSQNEIFLMTKHFIEAGKDIKDSSMPQIPLELAVVEICKLPDGEIKLSDLPKDEKPKTAPPPKKNDKIDDKKEEPKIEIKSEKPAPKKEITDKWTKLLEEIAPVNRSLYLILRESEPRKIENDKFYLAVKYKFYEERILNKKNYHIFNTAIKNCYGDNYSLECIVDNDLAIASVFETEDPIPVASEPAKPKDEESQEAIKNVMEVFEV